jgi:hypothetical protein
LLIGHNYGVKPGDYVIPVCLNIIFLSLCIRYISSTRNIASQQIINNRRKFHRTLLIQSILFYSIWLILWSPFVISFQFTNVNSPVGIATSFVNYVQVATDPIIVAIIDKRFLKAWRTTYRKFVGNRQRQVHPTLVTTTSRKY